MATTKTQHGPQTHRPTLKVRSSLTPAQAAKLEDYLRSRSAA